MKKISILFLSLFIFSGCSSSKNEVYKEYQDYLSKDHIFIKVNYSEIMDLFESNEDQIFYFGFYQCPNCQAAIKYINDVCKDLGYKKIYYFDVFDIRKEDSNQYKEFIEAIQYESDEKLDSGVSKLRVPTVLVRKNKETLGYITREYFIDETINDLNDKDKSELINALTDLYNKLK